ncbi:Neuropeptide FF receptor 2 [Mactra antiquata]
MSLSVGSALYIVFISAILVFAVFSNSLVIYCVYKYRKLRTVTNVLVCNLAVSDILLSGFVMPQKLHDISHEEDFYEGVALCKLVNFSPILVITSSIYSLVCVSVERERAIVHSTKRQMTFKMLYWVIPAIWVFACIVSVPTLIEYEVNNVTSSEEGNASSLLSCGSQHMPTSYSVTNATFLVLISYVFPVIIMTKNYSQVALFVWKKGRQIHNMQNNTTSSNESFKQRVKVVKLLVVVAVIFALSWLPFFILLLYAKITNSDASDDAGGFVNLFLIFLASFSTAYNVVLYVLYNPSFNRAIKDIFGCRRGATNDTNVNSQMPPLSTIQGSQRDS